MRYQLGEEVHMHRIRNDGSVSSAIYACCLVVILCAWLPVHVRAVPQTEKDEHKENDLLWGVKIPMRDGVDLNGTVYKPKGMDSALPVIFTLTPYISDSYHERADYFSKNGYVFALVDVRGRGSSEGEFTPFAQEAEDGHDVVEWLARQPWCNGKVAMWGGSYAGYNQWATLKEFPPHLVTIVPAAAAIPGVDFPSFNGIFYPYDIQWLTFTSGRTGNTNLFRDKAFWIQKYRELFLNHRPFMDLPQIVGNPSEHFNDWLSHPSLDAWHDSMNPSEEEFARMDMPILTITGHNDGDQPGAMAAYTRHTRFAPSRAQRKHFLVIGPWDHAGTRTPQKEFGGLTYGDASVIDMNELHKEWYDWTMKGGQRPAFLEKRVAYYVMGADEWKYADSVETISDETMALYLDSDAGMANDAFHSGFLRTKKPKKSQPDNYTYDPLDARPAELESEIHLNNLGNVLIGETPTVQTYALNLFGNGLVYHSEPFPEDIEVSGFPRFVAWISMDVPDTDFAVTLYEILPDGGSIVLSADVLRARYRESLREEKLVEPGEIYRYEFDDFRFFSRRISKGSRLRLVLQSPNSIYFQKNYNSGGVVAEETGQDARTAHITLHHDAEHPSSLELPIVR
jgi:putative CocE/NonD family hydrolase